MIPPFGIMKQNFVRDGERPQKVQTKGVAIRINSDLFEKIEQEETPRNELITQALNLYFNHEDNGTIQDDEIPIEVYEEIYSALQNNEISPLKKQCDHQQEIISSLKSQIQELQHDKQYFMNHCQDLVVTFQKQKKSFWRKSEPSNNGKQ